MAGKANVQYDLAVILSNQTANKISDLGYPASVMGNPETNEGKLELLVSENQ